MEVLLAAFFPPLFVLLLAQRTASEETRRAFRLFAVLALVWLVPCWATLSTNAPLDFLTGEEPWTSLRPPGYLNKNFLLNDVVLQLIPLREAARGSIAQGEWPFLNRYAGAGTPLWENMQLALLYPVNVVGLVFSSFAWPLFSASAKLLLAACGTYLFARRLGASHGGAIVAAIAFGFGAFNVAFLLFPLTNVTALLPLLLLAIDRLCERATSRSIAACVLVTWCVLVGGHPESVLHLAIVAVPFALWRNARATGRLALAALLAAALAAPILLPFAMWIPHTERMATIQRSEHFLATSTFTAESFIPFIVPNYFGNPRVHNYRHAINFNELCTQYAGLATLILALAGARRKHAFWIALFGVALLFAIMPLPVAQLVKHIPLLNITAHGRMRFVLAFAMAILAAFGFDAATRKRGTAIVVALGVIALCVLSYPLFAQYGIRRLVFFTELAALASAAALALGWHRAVPLLLFLDLASVMALYNPANPRALFYPPIPAMKTAPGERIVGIDKTLLPNSATMFRLEDIRPHDPLAFAPYVDLLVANGLDRTEYFPRFVQPPSEELLRFLGVRFVIEGTRVRSVDNPRPRYGNATVIRYRPNGATLRIDTAGRVETSELALPGWRIDSVERRAPSPAVVADSSGFGGRGARPSTENAFLTFDAQAGTYELRYVPRGLGIGALIAAIAAIATALWIRKAR